ncbi:MAG: hypothetical protein CMG02_00320 [Candidatus Marinimicrobia bacterium]|nr:hypothetical protein [Candidatus Neomarinimicrobiota bacterium]|tara:strand:+ start:1293 stop:2504 length:1212 start_codon:yes stop_codon:yes gene_type:complete
MINYKKIYNHIKNLRMFVLIVDWARPGSGLFQGCLDGHNEILQIPGIFRFTNIWRDIKKQNNQSLEKLIKEFINHSKIVPIFESKKQKSERWDQLGKNKNKSFKTSKKKFSLHMKNLLKNKKIDSKNFFLAAHASYFLSRNKNPLKTKVLFCHLHRYYEVIDHEKDFPNSNYIVITRDIRNGLVSYIESRKRSSSHAPETIYNCLAGAVRSLNLNNNQNFIFSLFTHYNLKKTINKLKFVSYKHLHEKPELVLKSVCKDLRIKFSKNILFKTTVNGLIWWGDKGSKKKFTGFSVKRANEIKWEKKLSYLDLLVMEILFFPYINSFLYKRNFNNFSINLGRIFLPILIFFPMKYELKFFLDGLKNKNKKFNFIKKSFYCYFKRVKIYLEAIISNLKINKKIIAY